MSNYFQEFEFMGKKEDFLFFVPHFVLAIPAECEFTRQMGPITAHVHHFTHIVFINSLPPWVQTNDFLLQFT